MISLLLTLFISMFSIGAPINTIEEPTENNITLPSKSMIDKDGGESYVLTTGDFEFYHFYSGLLDTLGIEWGFSNTDPKTYSHDISYGNVYSLKWTNYDNNDVDSWPIGENFYKLTIEKNILASSSVEYISRFWYRENNIDCYYSLEYIVGFNLTESGRPGYVQLNNLVLTRYLKKVTGSNTTYWPYNLYINITAYDDPCFDIFVKPVRDNKDGYQYGYDQGYDVGYNTGHQDGYNEGLEMAGGDPTALAIFTGITEIGLLPVNVFLKIFEFEVFGINISGLVGGLLTIAVVVIIIRFLLGERNS